MPPPALPLLLLTSAVITAEGTFAYRLTDREEAAARLRDAAKRGRLACYAGHPATTAWIARAFGIDVPVNRGAARQAVGQDAIVVRLARRPPAGDISQVADADVEIGVLRRLS